MTDATVPASGLELPPRGHLARFLRLPGAAAGIALTGTTLLVAALAPVLAPGDPFASVGAPFLAPSRAHPMGTDDLGRDLLRAVVHGARTSMVVVVSVIVISSVIGVTVGAVAGYGGGRVDGALMRATEMIQAVPRFFLAILAVALLGGGTTVLILVLALTSWPWLARVVRAETLSVKRRDFVDAARAVGGSGLRIVVRHILPQLVPSITVVVSLQAARVILLEASLGFLGLGDPNVMSWGYLANNAQRFLRTGWWLSVFPGLAIVLAVLGFTLVGDAVTAAGDPFSGAGRPRTRRESRSPLARRRLVPVLVGLTVLATAMVVVTTVVVDDGRGDQRPTSGPVPGPAARGPDGATRAGLAVGDCFDQPPSDIVEQFALVPCGQPHTDEVYAVVTIEAGPGARYPPRLDDQAERGCNDAFVTLVGVDPELSTLVYDWYAPTAVDWERGDRRVPCVLADPSGEPVTGTRLRR